jgi:hypothetical protein
MPSRNTGILTIIIENLGALVINPADALARLESRFNDQLLIVAGDTQQVASFAEELRLAISTPESATVLDYIGTEALAGVTIEHVEEAINTLFPGRFIEP